MNPAGNKKLSDSLPIYGESEEFNKLKSKGKIKVIILGNSYTGNYNALAQQFQGSRIDSSIVVMDYNIIPLQKLLRRLEIMKEMRQQDSLVEADITKMPFSECEKFNVMYGDFILSCLHPDKTSEFFLSVAKHLTTDGVLFLSVACNNFSQVNALEDIPFAFNFYVKVRNGRYQEYYYHAPFSLYKRLAEEAGLEFKILKQQVREDQENICDYYLAVTPIKKN